MENLRKENLKSITIENLSIVLNLIQQYKVFPFGLADFFEHILIK